MLKRMFLTRYENDIIKFNGKYYDYFSDEVKEPDIEDIVIAALEWFIEANYPQHRGICTGWFPVTVWVEAELV